MGATGAGGKGLSRRGFVAGATATAALAAAPARADRLANPWPLLQQGGLLLFMRHANAPGVGDPANFTLGDCSTQRNLSARGEQQATAVGATFRKAGVTPASVQSSRWCRCLDTARLAFGVAEPFDLLNSGFGREDATPALRRHLAALPRIEGNRLYVTHMVNIMRLLNVHAADAEIVFVRPTPDALITLGTVPPPAV